MSIVVTSAIEFRAAMAEAYREQSGFEPHEASDLGLRLSVLAAELEKVSVDVRQAGLNAFPQTATGQALDRLAQVRGLSRRPALAAGGQLRFSRTTPATVEIQIPAGTVCAGPGGLRFATTFAGAIGQGESETVIPAAAQEPGTAGNVAAFAVSAIISPLAGVSAVSNPLPFVGGAEQEDDEDLRARLFENMADPPGAFNAAFYRQGALSYPGVGSVQVLPMARGVGSVDVYIAALPGFDSARLAEALGGVFAQAREIGTSVRVAPAEDRPVDLACVVRVERGHTPAQVLEACRAALARVMAGQQVGQGLTLARLQSALIEIPGVENIRLVAPAADIPAQEGQLLVAGELEVAQGVLGMPEVSAR